MKKLTIQHAIGVCDKKILAKGENVNVSFYAFFKNKNNNPKELYQMATWWINTQKLDHFERSVKIKKMLEDRL